MSFWRTNLIYEVVIGSRAYGLDTPQSDTDTKGVCIPPRRYLLGLSDFEQWEGSLPGVEDAVVYSLRKVATLALASNPNILEMLFTARRHVRTMDESGRLLRESRDLFLSRRAADTFSGYAISQLRRIERHHRWLVDPPDHKPAPQEYGGQPHEGRYRFPHHEAERAYRAALKHWNHYQTWRRNRNPARAALEERHGYDTKHAMHLIRLLKMGAELLETGALTVYRPDRDWLMAIRNGLLTYEQLQAVADQHERRLQELKARSPLPPEPDRDAVERLVIDLHERSLRTGDA